VCSLRGFVSNAAEVASIRVVNEFLRHTFYFFDMVVQSLDANVLLLPVGENSFMISKPF
jgi:hypothetical protein